MKIRKKDEFFIESNLTFGGGDGILSCEMNHRTLELAGGRKTEEVLRDFLAE